MVERWCAQGFHIHGGLPKCAGVCHAVLPMVSAFVKKMGINDRGNGLGPTHGSQGEVVWCNHRIILKS